MKNKLASAAIAVAAIGLLSGSLRAQAFGSSVVVAGDQILVAETGNPNGGVVHVYTRSGDGWTETGSFMAPEPSEGDGFGRAMAISEDRLLVTSLSFARPPVGAVHSFVREGSEWRHDGTIVPEGLPDGMSVGGGVALSGDLAAVNAGSPRGGAGMVLVFRHVDGAWAQEAVLESPDAEENTGFGGSLALSGEMLVTGAPAADSMAGVAYVFEAGPEGWTVTGELKNDDGSGSFFGSAAMIMGDRVLVAAGSPFRQPEPGMLLAFSREEGEWVETGRLAAFDGSARDGFGSSMATDGTTLWVGAPGVHSGRGAIYEFAPDADGAWSSVTRIAAPEPEAGDGMGRVVAQGGGVLVSGMPRDDYGAGTAMIFEQDGNGWRDGALVFSEIVGYDPVVGGQLDCADGTASVFGCSDMDLVAFIPVGDLGGERGVRVNDIWGWTDPETQRDYALVGRTDGTSFVDVTDPVNPVVVGNLPRPDGVRGSSWRDMKVYENHMFVVSDGAPGHGIQVFDLTRLRGFAGSMLTFGADARYDRVSSVHNIVINEEAGVAFAVGSREGGETCGGGLHMIDIGDPRNPAFAGCFADTNTGSRGTGYTHDAQCVTYRGPDEEHHGREICFGANENRLSIADVTDKENPVALSVGAYPNPGYAHQGWLTEDQSYFFMGDETDEFRLVENTRTLIWDVKDLDDPQLVRQFFTENTSSDHNLYIVGDLMYQSNYNSGLRVFDISDPENPRQVGFFDTVPGQDSPAMDGSWSNYPFFKSGIVVVTSGSQGLFVVKSRQRTPVS